MGETEFGEDSDSGSSEAAVPRRLNHRDERWFHLWFRIWALTERSRRWEDDRAATSRRSVPSTKESSLGNSAGCHESSRSQAVHADLRLHQDDRSCLRPLLF